MQKGKALELMHEMHFKGFTAEMRVYEMLLNLFENDSSKCIVILNELMNRVFPSSLCYFYVLNSCVSEGDVEKAISFMSRLKSMCVECLVKGIPKLFTSSKLFHTAS